MELRVSGSKERTKCWKSKSPEQTGVWGAGEWPEANEGSQYRVAPWKCCVDTDFQVWPRDLQASKRTERPENPKSGLDKGSVSWRRAGWPELMPKA